MHREIQIKQFPIAFPSAHTHPVCDVCARARSGLVCASARKRQKSRAHSKAEAGISAGCVRALRSLGHGCVQEVKNNINTVRFLTQTARFVS